MKKASKSGKSNPANASILQIRSAEVDPRHARTQEDMMVLLGKVKVEVGFFEMVEFAFNEIYPYLLDNVEYTPQDLIGEPLWADWTDIAQRQAIFSLKHLAQMDDVPLIDISCPACGASVFEIVI